RKPILLDISNISPCICGILIRRNICKVIISDLKGNIVKQLSEGSFTKDTRTTWQLKCCYIFS
ncbi:hypothetical protein ACTPEM_23065, partial [Clostridioides difficile]